MVTVGLKLVLLVIVCEAGVEAIKHAAPLQPIKNWLISVTPFLYSKSQNTHLLSCPYCLSVYTGVICSILFIYIDNPVIWFIILATAFHRVSNYLHLLISTIRDSQMNMRISRGK
jgi:hypothetical protein